jgi:hypothetical protein
MLRGLRTAGVLVLATGLLAACSSKAVLPDTPLLDRLAREWRLSAEEGTPGREVYRTTRYQFPATSQYRPAYRLHPDGTAEVGYRTGTVERFMPGVYRLADNDQTLTVVAVHPLTRQPVSVRWRLVNVREDLLLVEPQP